MKKENFLLLKLSGYQRPYYILLYSFNKCI